MKNKNMIDNPCWTVRELMDELEKMIKDELLSDNSPLLPIDYSYHELPFFQAIVTRLKDNKAVTN